MKYSPQEIMDYIIEDDVKFIRLAFCDVFGKLKNIAIMPRELERAFNYGIAIDASAIAGFGGDIHSDLFLHPDPDTLSVLPWRPDHGRVVRMFCSVTYPDGSPFECDTRTILKGAIAKAEEAGFEFYFGTEMEFYLFKQDEDGNPTRIPYDQAGYMDIAPEDKGENIRREISLTLERMGILPEASHHEEGPGQNEIDFRYADPLTTADNAITFTSVVKTIANRNGLCADFSPKPLDSRPGNGMHINISAVNHNPDALHPTQYQDQIIAGVLSHIREITLFLNPLEESYRRLGKNKAPKYVSWSRENRSQLIRLPHAADNYKRMELRSPDPAANPYLAFSMLIYAALDGIRNKTPLPDAADFNLFTASEEVLKPFETLPASRFDARHVMRASAFVKDHLPERLIEAYANL